MTLSLRGLLALTASTLLAAALPAHAAYPDKPINLVVPFPAGSGTDAVGRIFAAELGNVLGQQVIVENRPGANATIAANYVARAEPDGYTLLYTTPGQQMTLPSLMKTMPYDPADLRPVSQVSLTPSVLVVNRKLGVSNLQQLIDLAKQRPGELNFVSAGIGASSHLNGELLQVMADIRLQHIPYRGTGEAVKDLVGGNGDIAIDSAGVYLSFIQDGRLVPLGVTTTEEVPLLPGVPPLSKTLPGYDASPVNYITVPAATSDAVVRTLAAALQATMAEPDVKQRLLKQGILAIANTPLALAVSSTLPVHSVQELIDYGKAHPGALSFSSCGTGTPQHFAGVEFAHRVGIDMIHVPYKGCGPAMMAGLGDQVQVMFNAISTISEQLTTDKIRLLAVTTKDRVPFHPEVPTLAELPDFQGYDFAVWLGFFVNAKTPQPIVDQLRRAFMALAQKETVRTTLSERRIVPMAMDGPALQALIATELVAWKNMVDQYGITLD